MGRGGSPPRHFGGCVLQSLVWGSKPQQCKSLPCRSLQGTAKQSRGRSSPDDVWPLLGRRNVRKGPWGRYARESAEGAGAIDGVAVQRPVCLTRYNQTVCVHPGKVMGLSCGTAGERDGWGERERVGGRESAGERDLLPAGQVACLPLRTR